ncbi:MAG: autotransporter outer membrane beta-barrel domain-containing protein [Gammaproteobacteria bacterium]|nr:autotransporter outer membrane beta-barrel domain-containing protein [Pseudomonadales bacterium]MCP5347993.1 autotransporter outer membrane beta-barrel domain-containing protein [Pseudomonadales bacterium]
MLRKLVLACGLLSVSSLASAQWVGGVGYYNLSADIKGYDVSPYVYGFSLGYEYETIFPDLTIIPGASLYLDANDDVVNVTSPGPARVHVENNFGMGVNLRFQWQGDSGLYFYVAPTLSRFDIEGSEPVFVNGQVIGKATLNEDNWLAGGGLGIGYRATDRISVEFSFEEYGDTDLMGLALRYGF